MDWPIGKELQPEDSAPGQPIARCTRDRDTTPSKGFEAAEGHVSMGIENVFGNFSQSSLGPWLHYNLRTYKETPGESNFRGNCPRICRCLRGCRHLGTVEGYFVREFCARRKLYLADRLWLLFRMVLLLFGCYGYIGIMEVTLYFLLKLLHT